MTRIPRGVSEAVPVVEARAYLPLLEDPPVKLSFVCVRGRQLISLQALTDLLLPVGTLTWVGGTGDEPEPVIDPDDPEGKVAGLYVPPEWRRLGIATLLWNVASELAEANHWRAPRHSAHRTELGDKFARSIGGQLPELEDDALTSDWDDGFIRP